MLEAPELHKKTPPRGAAVAGPNNRVILGDRE
jgi:hypothetical protein